MVKEEDAKAFDNAEKYFENSISHAAGEGALGFVVTSMPDITQPVVGGIEAADNMEEHRENLKEINELDEE